MDPGLLEHDKQLYRFTYLSEIDSHMGIPFFRGVSDFQIAFSQVNVDFRSRCLTQIHVFSISKESRNHLKSVYVQFPRIFQFLPLKRSVNILTKRAAKPAVMIADSASHSRSKWAMLAGYTCNVSAPLSDKSFVLQHRRSHMPN